MNLKDYLASLWTANLGVVPLFSLALFLFDPAFFNFNFLLILVCVVFEDISKSLSYLFNCNYRGLYLSRVSLIVKAFLIITPHSISYAGNQKDIFLSKGEQIELSIEDLSSFSVGNKEVLKYKYLKSKKKIYIKGKSIGFSDIIIWRKGQKKQTYNFYVTSKRDQLDKMKLGQTLKSSGLDTKVQGSIIYVTGEVKDLQTYITIKNILASEQKDLVIQVQLAANLKNQIISTIYLELNKQGATHYFCEIFKINIECFYEGDLQNIMTITHLQNYYQIKLSENSIIQLNSNLQLKFNILSLDKSSGSFLDSGFKEVEGSLENLLKNESTQLSLKKFFLKDSHSKVKVLATPEVLVSKESPFNLEIGKEILTPKQTGETTSYEWKFIGLKITGKLVIKDNKLKLKYSYKYTQGQSNKINGPKGSSEIYIKAGKPIRLFKIILSQIQEEHNGVPLLMDIPLFGGLFRGSFDNSLDQNVNVYVTLSNIQENS